MSISQDQHDQLPKNREKLFTPYRKTFERKVKRTGIGSAEGQSPHVLHDILSHSKITMIYANFVLDHLDDTVT